MSIRFQDLIQQSMKVSRTNSPIDLTYNRTSERFTLGVFAKEIIGDLSLNVAMTPENMSVKLASGGQYQGVLVFATPDGELYKARTKNADTGEKFERSGTFKAPLLRGLLDRNGHIGLDQFNLVRVVDIEGWAYPVFGITPIGQGAVGLSAEKTEMQMTIPDPVDAGEDYDADVTETDDVDVEDEYDLDV